LWGGSRGAYTTGRWVKKEFFITKQGGDLPSEGLSEKRDERQERNMTFFEMLGNQLGSRGAWWGSGC